MTGAAIDQCFSLVHSQTQGRPEAEKMIQRAITISRQTGCGALEVSEEVGRLMNHHLPPIVAPWTVFDRNLMDKVLEDHQLPPSLARYLPEDRISELEDLITDVFGIIPTSQTAARQTAETILRLVEIGGVVVIGRGANIITAKLPRVLHVRLVAPLADRIARISATDHKSLADARRFCEEEDLARARYLKKHFDANIDDPHLYHMVLNTSRLGYDETARLIADAAQHLN
jgi:cytidylate kinase